MRRQTYRTWTLCAGVLLWTLAGGRTEDHKTRNALVVGWNDEFNTARSWTAFAPPNTPDVRIRHRGAVELRIGKGAIADPNPRPYYWATLSRVAEVDVARYPILAVCARHLQGPAWWDVTIQGWRDGKLTGREVKTPSLDHDGVILFDVSAQAAKGLELDSGANTGDVLRREGEVPAEAGSGRPALPGRRTQQIRLRINIAGTKKGCSAEYTWIRFIRRQDAERLRENPRIQDLVVEP